MVHVCIILLQKCLFEKGLFGFDCRVLFWHRSEMFSSKCCVLFGLCAEFRHNEPNSATSACTMRKTVRQQCFL